MPQKKVKKKKTKNPYWLKPYQFKKGEVNNPHGRPRVSGKSLKAFARDLLRSLPPEEKKAYLNDLLKRNPEIVWKMAEGNPAQDTETTLRVEAPVPILDLKQLEMIEGEVSNPTETPEQLLDAKNEPNKTIYKASDPTPHARDEIER